MKFVVLVVFLITGEIAKAQFGTGYYIEGKTLISRVTPPTSKHSEGKGQLVMRSSWDVTESFLVYKAVSKGNHYYCDQGIILLTHNREKLLSNAGHNSFIMQNCISLVIIH